MAESEIAHDIQASITKEFLESVLKRKVVKYEASAGSKPGDGFMCILISLEIFLEDQDKPIYLIMKTFPSHPTRRKLLEDSNTHLKEYQMYKIWLPELTEFQKSVIKPETILMPSVPKVLAGATVDYYSVDPNNSSEVDPILSNYLLMVDVRRSFGFEMADKLKSLGYHHVKVVFEELAKYHALGHAYRVHHNLTSILTKFPFMDDRFYLHPKQRDMIVSTMKVSMDLVRDACKDFLEKNPNIRESIRKYEDAVLIADQLAMFMDPKGMDEKEVEALMSKNPAKFSGNPIPDQWLVPCHGDCWTNNILFKPGKDGNISECVLVDLQETKECCLMVELIYLLYTSCDTDFRKKYALEMLKIYYDKFLYYCGVLKTKPFPNFTLENLERKYQRSKLFGFLFATFMLPIFLQKPETTVDMETVEVGDVEASAQWAEILKKRGEDGGRDDDDMKLLRDRFTELMTELHEEGVL